MLNFTNLPDVTDVTLVKKVKEEDCSKALSELISRHSGICYNIYNRYFPCIQTVDAQEVKEHKDLLIYNAAKSFDETREVKFSTWLGNVVTYACLNVCDSKNKNINLDEKTLHFLVDAKNNEHFSFDTENQETIDYIKDILDQSGDENSKQVVKLRYFSNEKKPKTFKTIGKLLGVSTQTAVNWHDKFIEFLKNKLTGHTICDII